MGAPNGAGLCVPAPRTGRRHVQRPGRSPVCPNNEKTRAPSPLSAGTWGSRLAVRTGLEPATSGVTGQRSNQTELPDPFLFCVSRKIKIGETSSIQQLQAISQEGLYKETIDFIYRNEYAMCSTMKQPRRRKSPSSWISSPRRGTNGRRMKVAVFLREVWWIGLFFHAPCDLCPPFCISKKKDLRAAR